MWNGNAMRRKPHALYKPTLRLQMSAHGALMAHTTGMKNKTAMPLGHMSRRLIARQPACRLPSRLIPGAVACWQCGPPEGIAVYRNMAATRLKTFSRRHDAPLGIRQYGGRRCRPGPHSHANGQRQAAITAEHARLCMPVCRPRLEERRCRWCMKVA